MALLAAAAALLMSDAAAARGPRGDGEYKTPATEAYKQADVRINAASAAYRGALLPLLRSRDPYQRRVALDRLQYAGLALFDRDVQAALLPILEETALLPSETCAREPARCGEAPPVSNGMLAARLRRSDVSPELLVAHIVARPAAADAVIAAGASLSAADLSKALWTTKSPAAQAALLRLTLPSACGYSEPPQSIIALQDSPDLAVRRLAALAVLRYTGCDRSPSATAEKVRKRALAAVAARFDDAADADVVADCLRIGAAADVFIPQLLARLERQQAKPPERLLILQTLATMDEHSRSKDVAIAQLYRMLLDPAQRPVHARVLLALQRLWPHRAPEAKPALLALIAAEPELFTHGIGLVHAWGAHVTRAELARLVATYRRGCLSDDGEICGAQSRILGYLAKDSSLAFEPLGRDRDNRDDGD
jgi:hypothetical protein